MNPITVTMTYKRTNAHITANRRDTELGTRIQLAGGRWVGKYGYWRLPIRKVRGLAEELSGAGYDVVVQR